MDGWIGGWLVDGWIGGSILEERGNVTVYKHLLIGHLHEVSSVTGCLGVLSLVLCQAPGGQSCAIFPVSH